MPVATVSTAATRYELISLPADPSKEGSAGEGGFIMARPLPYGMKLDRRDKGTKMSMEQEIQKTRKKRAQNSEPDIQKIELETLSSWMVAHDFAYCITEHNLTDVRGNKLDFSNPMGVKALDPRVGSEIERILNELNDDDEDEATMEDFTTLPSSSSPVSLAQSSEANTVTN